MAITRADTRLTDKMIDAYTSAGFWNVPTFPELLERNARLHSTRIGFVDDHREISWIDLWNSSRLLAFQLLKLGVGRGDVVGVQLPNRIEFVVAMGAIGMIGAVICPYVVTLRRSEAKFVLGFSKAVVAIVPQPKARQFDLAAMTAELKSELPELKHIIVVGDDAREGYLSFDSLLSESCSLADCDGLLRQRAPGVHDINRVLFTSGSTGDPKGVVHIYATTIFSNIRQNEHMEVDEQSVLLLFIPITLNWGMFQVIQTALAPCRLLLREDFSPEGVLETVAEQRVSHFGTPPAGLIALVGAALRGSYDLSSLKLVVSAGSSCPIELLHQTREVLGIPVMEGYGMTECGWISATQRSDRPEDAVGTVGFPFPWMDLRVCNEQGQELPGGTVGEITLNGPCICLGYYNNAERNEASWRADGRYKTGDLGVIEPSGRLRIVGRTKDIIKHGGSIIHPRELEELIFTHPKVAQVAVVGVPDAYFGENSCACVVTKSAEILTLNEIIEFLRDRVASYKLPQRLELFDQLPYTSTGKVQKHLLQQQVLALESSHTHEPRCPKGTDE
jgi:non-ribosomal peptide synthetase component E (peptide arylation enzyme)